MRLQDHFLIATPSLDDYIFTRSVIYICEHNDQGTIGITLTNPTDISISELILKVNSMNQEREHFLKNDLVLSGGPVNVEQGFVLHTESEFEFQASIKVNNNLTLSTSLDIIKTLGTKHEPEKFLITLGCSTWHPEQLEDEIMQNFWLVSPANEHILFELNYDQRWEAANQLLGINVSNLNPNPGWS